MKIAELLLQEAVYKSSSNIYIVLNINIGLREPENITRFKSQIIPLFEKLGGKNIEVKDSGGNKKGYRCYWTIDDEEKVKELLHSDMAIDNYIDHTVIPFLKKSLGNKNEYGFSSSLSIEIYIQNEIPSFFMFTRKFAFFNIDCKTVKSFQNIDKIKSAEVIYFKNATKWKGPALNILNITIPKVSINLVNITNNSSTAWFDIIKKHFDNDRDILACKEELVNAGLKEMAKL